MCDCVDKAIEFAKKNYPKKNGEYIMENATFPLRQTFDTVLIKYGNKKQRVAVLHNYCPHCGKSLKGE